MSFGDECFEKIGDNLFQVSVILSSRDGKDNKTFVGKSTRSVKKDPWREDPQINIEIAEFMEDCRYYWKRREMKEEAKRAAISAFFKEVYGYTDTSDIAVDDFDRPRIDKTGQTFLDCSTIDLTTES